MGVSSSSAEARSGTGIILDGTAITVGERFEYGGACFLSSRRQVLSLLTEIGERRFLRILPAPQRLVRHIRRSSPHGRFRGGADCESPFHRGASGRAQAGSVFRRLVTLHVGLGTFRPVQCSDIRGHVIHEEYCVLPLETKNLWTKRRGGR